MLKDFVSLSSALLWFIIPSYTVSQVAPPAAKDGPVIVTRQTLHHDVSPSLRDLAAARARAPQPVEEREVDELKVIPLAPGFKPATEPDTVLQRTIAKTSAVAPSTPGPVSGLNFEGLGTGIPNFVIVGAPPDTEGAVGATQYVQWVNTSFAVFDKTSGAMTFGPVLANTLWTGFGGGCETNNDGDPIVNYDKMADRWVFTQFVVRSQPFLQCVAVSTTSDATGPYFRYSFQYSNFDDYPKLGVWPDAYYITFNMFQGNTFLGSDACAYDRNAMLQGLPATQICFQQASGVGSLLPADLDGHISPPAGSPNYMLDFDVNSLNLYKFHVDFSNPANSTFTGPLNIPVAPFSPFCPSVRGCVPQPSGDGTNLDSLGDRLMYRLAYRNFGDHESLVVNHSVVADGTVGNSGVRWYEIQDPNGATPVVAQQSTLAPDAGSRWMGSAAMDASGNLAVGYSVIGNPTTPPFFASIALAARGAFDPPSTLGTETTIVAGKGSQTGGLTRWGDYSAMQVDPADDCTFWYTNEYLQNTGSFNWNTRIATFKFPGCGATALSMSKSHSGKFTQGQTGATYSLVVTNIGSKPTDGTAITVTDTLPAALTATAISSTDATWVCTLGTLSCTRSDVLAPGQSYPAITVTVNVALSAPGLVTNTATVTGGGNKDTTDNTANDVTTVIQTGSDPAIVMTHVPLVANQTAIYTITVSNVGLSPTDGTQVTVTDALPRGLAATAITSTDPTWVCTLGTLSCTRSDVLAPGSSYPRITVSVNVGAGAQATVVNTASVSGGGDVNPLNNTATDPATVLALPPGLAFTNPAIPLVPAIALDLKPGIQIAITGTATGPSFQDFKLQSAEGINPTTGWSSAGITLAGGGAPVTNGPLGTWDTSAITQADFYSIRLTVDDSGFSNSLVTFVYLDPSLLSVNWPVALTVAPHLDSGFLPVTDPAGKQRLVLVTPIYGTSGSNPPQYFSFVPDNSSRNVIDIAQPSYLNPAVGNIDGSPGDQVVISDAPLGPEQVEIFRSDNTSFAFSVGQNFPLYILLFDQPVLEDVGGKGELDVTSLANKFSDGFGVDPAALFAWHPDGSLLSPNFPIIVPDLNVSLALGFKPRVFVADLQGSGTKEFIVETGPSSSTFTILLFAADGTPIPWAVPVFSGFPMDLALADLDHNGKLETVLLMADNSGNGSLHVFQPDGSERPGFPVSVGPAGGGHLAVGDLNRDGTEEIVVLVRNSNLVVLEPDGTPFPGAWSQIAPPGNILAGPLALADINGDGFPEILLTAYQLVTPPSSPAPVASSDQVGRATIETTHSPEGLISQTATTDVPASQQTAAQYWAVSLLAVGHDAKIARSWNMLGAAGNQPFSETKITVGDFNQDGLTDIAVTYFTIDGGGISGFLTGGVASVLTTGAHFNAAANDWPMIHHDPHNTAVLRRAVTVVLTSPLGGGTVAGTVPITAVTSGNVASVQFKIDGTNFGAAVTTAPFTAPWDTTQSALGSHQLQAVAVDSNGQAVASAPLTVTVIRGTSSSVTLALTAGGNPSTFGDSITFTATVTPNTATGSVTFFDGTTPITGAVPLSSGSASLATSLLASGTHNITAQYSGDPAVGSSVSAPLMQTVQPAPLTITAADSTTVYGVAPAPFSGSISGAKNGDVFTLHFSTTATLASPPGAYPVTPNVTGSDLQNYTVHAVNGTLTITQASTNATVLTSNASVTFGTPVTFTATIASATIGTPTGSVQFLDGATALGTVTLNAQGVAALTTSSLSVGSHSITGQYTGDTNFNGSISPVVSQQVIPVDFSIGASPSSATIRAGGSASFTFTVTPVGGFNQTVNFSCTGLPAESQCTFAPASVTPNGSPATSMLTITTTAPSAVLGAPPVPKNNLPLYASLSGAMLGMLWIACSAHTRVRVRSRLLLLAGSLCLLASLTSCGGGGGGGGHHDPGTPPGTSSVTVTATSGSNSHPSTVMLNVTN